jgi:patatin-like phospholipase/acyl hydrolase
MKRILALDGGGIRGLFTLQILARIEQLLRDERKRPDLVLADEFDLFAGTSTGAIIASGLCWGMSVAEIEQFYLTQANRMFTRAPWFIRWKARYRSDKLADVLRGIFCEDGPGNEPALLSSSKLRKMLLVVMRNASTGSPWPVSNNRNALFNDIARPDSNLSIPIWQLVRASTAAPTYYAPERIRLGEQSFIFVDGAITPFNNPALIAVLMATLPCYRVCWPTGRDKLLVVSIGTGAVRTRLSKRLPEHVHMFDILRYVPPALLESSADQQDMLCRILGDCVFGAPLDLEMGDLQTPSLLSTSEQKFTYVRYNVRMDEAPEVKRRRLGAATVDNLKLMPILKEIGRDYAERYVTADHLHPRPASA